MASGKAVAARVADHVIPHKGDYTLFATGVLQSLCFMCHDQVKQRMEKQYKLKLMYYDDDGWPLPKPIRINRRDKREESPEKGELIS